MTDLDSAATTKAASVRELLLPILHRWGVGMQKGGALVYPRVGDGCLIVGERVMRNPRYSCYPLKLLHPKLYSLMWEQVGNGEHVVDYMEPIPLSGEPIERVWAVLGPETPCSELTAIPFPVTLDYPSIEVYYGPISKAFYEDIGGEWDSSVERWGGDDEDLVSYLPPYEPGYGGTWKEDWEYGYIGR